MATNKNTPKGRQRRKAAKKGKFSLNLKAFNDELALWEQACLAWRLAQARELLAKHGEENVVAKLQAERANLEEQLAREVTQHRLTQAVLIETETRLHKTKRSLEEAHAYISTKAIKEAK